MLIYFYTHKLVKCLKTFFKQVTFFVRGCHNTCQEDGCHNGIYASIIDFVCNYISFLVAEYSIIDEYGDCEDPNCRNRD